MNPERADPLIQEILAADEFSRLEPTAEGEAELIAELAQATFAALEAWLAGTALDSPRLFLAILLVCMIVLAGLTWWGARGAARRRLGANVQAEHWPEILRGDPKILRAEAHRAAAQGDWFTAVRALFRAQIIAQALAEGILTKVSEAENFRRARTYRELVAEFGRGGAEPQKVLASRIEAALYGHAALTEADWRLVLSLERS